MHHSVDFTVTNGFVFTNSGYVAPFPVPLCFALGLLAETTSVSNVSRCPNVFIISRLGNIRGLSGTYPAILNISRAVHVALM